MAHHCYHKNQIIPIQDATFHVHDLGLLRGYGLFDYFRTYNGRPFQWDWYWERFERSARLMRLYRPIEKEDAYKIVMQLVEKSGSEDCAIRFLLTGGYSPDSVTSPAPSFAIMSEDIHPVKPIEYENGIKIMSYEYVRDLPEVKSSDYKHFMILQEDLKASKSSDVLFKKDGEISELSRSNFFIFKGDTLVTPNRNILHGITKRTVLELAKPHFKIEERPLLWEELADADEVFTTSTTKRVLPITEIDDQIFSNHKIGKNTAFLLKEINDLVEKW